MFSVWHHSFLGLWLSGYSVDLYTFRAVERQRRLQTPMTVIRKVPLDSTPSTELLSIAKREERSLQYVKLQTISLSRSL
jgi:hypothetical protein